MVKLDVYTYKVIRSINGIWFGVAANRVVERIEVNTVDDVDILHHLERATASGDGLGPSVEKIQFMLEKLLAEGDQTIIIKETKRKLMDLIKDFELNFKE